MQLCSMLREVLLFSNISYFAYKARRVLMIIHSISYKQWPRLNTLSAVNVPKVT